jgi:hypothetical protein
MSNIQIVNFMLETSRNNHCYINYCCWGTNIGINLPEASNLWHGAAAFYPQKSYVKQNAMQVLETLHQRTWSSDNPNSTKKLMMMDHQDPEYTNQICQDPEYTNQLCQDPEYTHQICQDGK